MQSNERRTTQLRRAKATVTAVFIAHGLVFSSWAAHIPHVKAELGLSDAALGTALFGAPLGSVVATLLSHWALPRWASHRLIPVTVAGYVAAGATVGLSGSAAALFGALAVWGLFQGALDVAMNTQAGTVERLAGLRQGRRLPPGGGHARGLAQIPHLQTGPLGHLDDVLGDVQQPVRRRQPAQVM